MRENLILFILFSCRKFISFSTFFVFLLSNSIVAEELLTKSNECFEDFQYKVCSNLFMEMEKIQIAESDQNRYKCQASILGLQTELVEAYYFKKFKKNKYGIMIPYVIKNC